MSRIKTARETIRIGVTRGCCDAAEKGRSMNDHLPHRLNKGVFIGVAARQAAGVIYETYLLE